MPEYTFDRFIVSPISSAAVDACRAIAERYARPRTPLFLHGPTRSGKTHLLYAIAGEMRLRRPAAIVLQMSTSNFVWRMLDAMRDHEWPNVRRRLAAVDALLLDDFPCEPSMKRTRGEIFMLVELLARRRAPVVITFHDRLMKRLIRRRFPEALIAELGSRTGMA